jgi:hypothetical protein
MPTSYSFQNEVEQGLQACNSTFGCSETLVVSLIALVAWAGFSTGFLFTARTNVQGAMSALRSECEAVAAERDALANFVTRLEELPTTQLQGTSVQAAGIGVASSSSQPSAEGMSAVEDAYRETVMAVNHYEEDYGEPFPHHLASEFGEELAGAVVANDRLTPQVKSALLTGAREGRRQRTQYLSALKKEQERLVEADRTFDAVADCCEQVDGNLLRRRPFEELQGRFERLDSRRETLTQTLQTRQEQLHEGITFGWDRRDAESVYRYLYEDIDATYPVLADGSVLLERVKDVETRLTTALTSRM